jgi:hypothetical protein
MSPNSIDSWEQLEHKFHDHFYSHENEFKLSDLTSVRQGRDVLMIILGDLETLKTDALI